MRCIARLLLAIFSVVLGWLITTPTDGAAAAPVVVETAYVYDTTHHSVPCLSATSERGPPDTTYDYTASGSTVDAKSNGTSTRPQPAATLTFTTYDHGARSAQLDNGRATSGTAADARRGRLRPVSAASVAAKSAEDFVGPLSKAEYDGLQKSLEPNKLNHLFAKQEHGLDGLVSRYGSQEAVVEQMYRGLSGAVSPGSDGLFSVTRTIGGEAVTIDGRVVNGIPRIGTAYIKP